MLFTNRVPKKTQIFHVFQNFTPLRGRKFKFRHETIRPNAEPDFWRRKCTCSSAGSTRSDAWQSDRKKGHDFPQPKWRRWSDRGQTSPAPHKVGTVILKLKFIQIGSAVPEIIAKNLDHAHPSNHFNACNCIACINKAINYRLWSWVVVIIIIIISTFIKRKIIK